jgi:hypothetical protein
MVGISGIRREEMGKENIGCISSSVTIEAQSLTLFWNNSTNNSTCADANALFTAFRV